MNFFNIFHNKFPTRDFYLIVLWVKFVISFPRRGLSCGVFSLYLEEREEWIRCVIGNLSYQKAQVR